MSDLDTTLAVAEFGVPAAGLVLLGFWAMLRNLPHRNGEWLGPLFGRELVRLARNPTMRRLMVGFVLLMLVGLFVTFLAAAEPGSKADLLLGRVSLPESRMQSLAENYLICYLGIQMVAVLAIAPFLGAGGIVEERERNRLDFLLSSPLQSHEIVFGIVLSRIVAVLAIMAAGLPVLMLSLLFGGVDLRLLLLGEVLTAFAAASHMAYAFHLGVRHGMMGRVLWTYFTTVILLLVTGALCGCIPPLSCVSPAAALGWAIPHDNLWYKIHRLNVLACLAMQIIGIMVYLSRAIRNLTREAVFEGKPVDFDAAVLQRRGLVPALMDENPLAWREAYFGTGRMLQSGDAGSAIILSIATIFFGFACVYGLMTLVKALESRGEDSAPLLILTSMVAVVALVVMTSFVVLKSGGTIAREREKQSLDELRMIPLERGELLAAKLQSLRLSTRLFLTLFALGLLATLAASFHLSLLGVVPATAMAVGTLMLAKGLGCWCSVVCRTSLRATSTTLCVHAGLMFLPMLVRLPLEATVEACGFDTSHEVGMFIVATSPIVGVRYSLFTITDSVDNWSADTVVQDEAALLGATFAAAVYALVGILLYRRACRLLERDD